MSVGLAEILMRAGLGFVWGSFRRGKGLISRMLLGGFQFRHWIGLGCLG